MLCIGRQSDYLDACCSRGGNVQCAVKVEATLVREPEGLRKRIDCLFRLAERSLAEKLAALAPDGDANNNGEPRRRMATDRQLPAIERLAQQSDAAIDQLLLDVFDIDGCENVSVAEASQLIGILQDRLRGGPAADRGA